MGTDNPDKSLADRIIAKAMMYLFQTAANDGIITDEERELLETFEFSMKKYQKALDEAYEDGIITEEEEQRLEKLKEVIINGGRIVADLDNKMSKDEINLLVSVMLSLDVPKKDS